MKNKKTSCCCEVFFCCFLFCIVSALWAQEKVRIEGIVVKSLSNTPLESVLIRLTSDPDVFVYSDASGRFSLLLEMENNRVLEFDIDGFETQLVTVAYKNESPFYMGTIALFQKEEELVYSNTLELSDDDLLENDIGGANVVTGLLQSSKDVFVRTAAFNFGQARFKIRGYDSREGTVLINGIKMNKIQTGRPNWSNWGGLNDVLRNFSFSYGIAPASDSFGSVLGATNFKTNASEYRPGSAISYAASNGSYKGRFMMSHFTGILKNNWSFAFSFSTRFAGQGAIQGTNYSAYSGFISAEKRINESHRIGLTGIFAMNQRGKSSANTQEVLGLKGARYNSYWGYQQGKHRNSRVQKVNEPIVMLFHQWTLDTSAQFKTSISYQFGSIGSSRLGYANVNSPDPSYYKYLPSAALKYDDFGEAYRLTENFVENGQINWSELYETNSITQNSSYYLYEDRTEDTQFSLRATFKKSISLSWKIEGVIGYRNLTSNNYAKVLDDLGGGGFWDVDSFEQGDKAQNNLHTVDNLVGIGAAFSYNYKIDFSELEGFLQSSYILPKVEFVGALNYTKTAYYRTGNFKNGKYPDASFGASSKMGFDDISAKLNTLYKFSGKHLLYGNIAFISRAPALRSVYSNIRISNNATKNVTSERIKTVDVNYQYRAPRIKSRLTGYYSCFSKGSENSFLFAEGLKGGNSDFVGQSLTNISKRHIGVELGIDVQLSSEISLNIVTAVGSYTYSNNPNLKIETDIEGAQGGELGEAFTKGYHIGGSPEKAFSLGVNYRNPAYWWVAVNGNFLKDHYLSISPLLRTSNFYLDADEVPFTDELTGAQISKSKVSELLEQEKFDDLFLLNLVGGKSWKFRDTYIGLFLSLNNVLGEVYKTGGYEQSRKANFKELHEDTLLKQPQFGSKYWMQNGTSYYMILSVRF
jgi:hypothetical protein